MTKDTLLDEITDIVGAALEDAQEDTSDDYNVSEDIAAQIVEYLENNAAELEEALGEGSTIE